MIMFRRLWYGSTIWVFSTSFCVTTYSRLPMSVPAESTSATTVTTSIWRALASPSNPINGITTNTVANAAARVPYLGFTAIGLQQNAFDAIYNYQSLQTSVRKNFSRGHAFQAAYTWSKNLSNVGFNSSNENVSTDMWQQHGETPYSRPQRFVVTYQYEFPFKTGGALGKTVEGWSASGSTIIQGGNPMTLFDGRGGTIYYGGGPSNGPDKGSSRAQLCPGFTYKDIATKGSVKERLGRVGDPNAKRFFNPAAFCPPSAVGNGTDFGNTGRSEEHTSELQ